MWRQHIPTKVVRYMIEDISRGKFMLQQACSSSPRTKSYSSSSAYQMSKRDQRMYQSRYGTTTKWTIYCVLFPLTKLDRIFSSFTVLQIDPNHPNTAILHWKGRTVIALWHELPQKCPGHPHLLFLSLSLAFSLCIADYWFYSPWNQIFVFAHLNRCWHRPLKNSTQLPRHSSLDSYLMASWASRIQAQPNAK